MIATIDRRAGFCGWFGAVDVAIPPGDALTRMAGVFDDHKRVSKSSASFGAALHLTPGTPLAGFYTGGGLIAAIDGYPEWSKPELARIAHEKGNATALAEAYREIGLDLLQHLHGPFVVAVLDEANRRAIIANDRLGIHSVSVQRVGEDGLLFSTTTDAIAAHPVADATIAPQAVFNFLFHDHLPAPMTIYANQEKLLAGQCLKVCDGVISTEFYWHMSYEDGGRTSRAELKVALFENLRGAVGRAVAGENLTRVGAFLSGGLDSSTIFGLLAEVIDGPAKAFTIGYDHEGYDETEYARTAAEHFGAEHVEYTLTADDVVDILPRIAEAYDEPFANSSAVPAYYCARCAREHGVDVLLAGDGGDELFAGNKHYARMKLFETYHALPTVLRRKIIEPIVFGIPYGESLLILRKARRYIAQANTPMPERAAAFALDVSQVRTRKVVDGIDADQSLAILRDTYQGAPASSFLQNIMRHDLQVVLADNDLRKVNRMCALAGVRVRYPMLDEGVVALSGKIPASTQLPWLKLRAFYKWSMNGFLPEKVLKKPKHGFALPYGRWLKEHRLLRELTYDSISTLTRRSYVRPDYIEFVMSQFRNNDHAVFSGPVWNLMMFELWIRSHVDNRLTVT